MKDRLLPATSRGVVLLLLSTTVYSTTAQEWTRFRGPNGTGVSNAENIPVRWTESDYNWKVALPGQGHASPVIWGNKVFLLSGEASDATRYVICLDATSGESLWTRSFTTTEHAFHPRNSYASSTPAVDDQHLYATWASPDKITLIALTHDGDVAWEKDLGKWQSMHGYAASPIVFEDLVVLHNSQQAVQLDDDEQPGESHMMAFDKVTGAERWRTPLKSATACYSVPFVYRSSREANPELVCTSTGNGFFSLDPKTGAVNWSVDAFTMRTVSSPILAGGLIFGSNGVGSNSPNYVVAIKPQANPEIAYQLRNSDQFKAPYVPTFVAHEDLVFMLYDRGFASCVEATSGEVVWSERIDDQFSGSPVLVQDRIYCLNQQGEVVVMRASRQLEILARNPLGESSRATPAISGGRMYLRTLSHLISIGGSLGQ